MDVLQYTDHPISLALGRIPLGYSVGIYKGVRYGLSRSVFNDGRSQKVYAEELKGKDVISLNYYETKEKHWLKPCEMTEEKVLDFLYNVDLHSVNAFKRTTFDPR